MANHEQQNEEQNEATQYEWEDAKPGAELHVVVGAGAVGSSVAGLLADAGHRVKVISRSGSGPSGAGIQLVKLDAANSAKLAQESDGATAIYNCANPQYHQWATAWPPLAKSLLAAAEQTGAVLSTMSNLYGYADPTVPMTEDFPLRPSSKKGQIRVDMWNEAKAAHDAGKVRITEARASDYIGSQITENGQFADRLMPKLLKSKSVSVLGDPRQPHSWTSVDDAARALVTLAAEPAAWGKAWHVPTAAPVTAEDMVTRICQLAGIDPVKTKSVPSLALTVMGVFMPVIRELKEMQYQWDRPFIIDSSAFTKEFGWDHQPLDETLLGVIEAYRK